MIGKLPGLNNIEPMKRDVKEYYSRAEEYIKEEKYEEGIELYKKLMETHPDNDSLVMSLAWAYQDSGKTHKAIKCLERLLEKELAGKIFTGFAFDELVRIYRDECHYEKLLSLCERVVALHPNDVSLLTTLGDACLRSGKTTRAIQVFEMLTEMESDSPVHFCSLGNAHIAAGNIREGTQAYEKAALIDQEEASIFFDRLGHVLSHRGYFAEAENAVKRSIEINDREPTIHCSLGDILITQGKVVAGMAFYDNAIELDPPSQGSYYNRLGNVLTENSYHHDALGAYGKAVAAEPENPFYRMRLAESYKREGGDEQADNI